MIEREYRYRPDSARMMFITLLLAGGALLFGNLTLKNDRGLRLNGIPFSKNGATALYGVLASLFTAGVVIGGIRKGIQISCLNQRVGLCKDGVLVPMSDLSQEERLIPYCDILSVEGQETRGIGEFAVIRYRGGKFRLLKQMLPKGAYDEIVHEVVIRARAVAGATSPSQPVPASAQPMSHFDPFR
jgi:hypothetical protein